VIASLTFTVSAPAEASVGGNPVLTCTNQSTALADAVRAERMLCTGSSLLQGV